MPRTKVNVLETCCLLLYEGCDFGERFESLRSMFEPLKIPFHTFDPSLKHYKPLRPIDELGMTCAH